MKCTPIRFPHDALSKRFGFGSGASPVIWELVHCRGTWPPQKWSFCFLPETPEVLLAGLWLLPRSPAALRTICAGGMSQYADICQHMQSRIPGNKNISHSTFNVSRRMPEFEVCLSPLPSPPSPLLLPSPSSLPSIPLPSSTPSVLPGSPQHSLYLFWLAPRTSAGHPRGLGEVSVARPRHELGGGAAGAAGAGGGAGVGAAQAWDKPTWPGGLAS